MTLAVLLVLAAAVMAVVMLLAHKADRRTVALLLVAGMLGTGMKIAVFQQAPQWHDILPDAITYHLNGEAFAMHWRGLPVSVDDYKLRGLEARQMKQWSNGALLPYSAVYGSADWIYPAYVGIWYWAFGPFPQTVIVSNAVFGGFFAAAAFGMTILLGGARRTAIFAAGIALIDPSAGVNASWLLKDTLVGFLAMTALWAGLEYLRSGRMVSLIVLTTSTGILGAGRFVAFGAILISLLVAGLVLLRRRSYRKLRGVLIAGVGAVLVFGWLYFVPLTSNFIRVPKLVSAFTLTTKSGVDTLKANTQDSAADNATIEWLASWNENPVLAMTKSVAHTLFAPYPWVAIYPGLTWSSFSELYYPGVIVWVACLPGIFVAVFWAIRHRRDEEIWFVLTFLGVLLAAYTLFQGEWSTRQRVFALPAFFVLASIGWDRMLRWRRSR